jgi:hypothetical protein
MPAQAGIALHDMAWHPAADWCECGEHVDARLSTHREATGVVSSKRYRPRRHDGHFYVGMTDLAASSCELPGRLAFSLKPTL